MSERQAVYTPRVIELRLPWPNSALSPNSRGDWRTKQSPKERARGDGLEAGSAWGGWKPAAQEPIELRLMFFPPDLRRRDIDNLHASMKATIDGIAQGLGFDDWQIRRTVLEWGAVDKPGYVLVEIVPFLERGELPY